MTPDKTTQVIAEAVAEKIQPEREEALHEHVDPITHDLSAFIAFCKRWAKVLGALWTGATLAALWVVNGIGGLKERQIKVIAEQERVRSALISTSAEQRAAITMTQQQILATAGLVEEGKRETKEAIKASQSHTDAQFLETMKRIDGIFTIRRANANATNTASE